MENLAQLERGSGEKSRGLRLGSRHRRCGPSRSWNVVLTGLMQLHRLRNEC